LSEAFEGTAEATAPTERSERAVTRDPEKPRLGIGDLIELISAAERFVEAVLKKVFGKRSIADHLRKEAA
jgi:hypothetical protein